MEYEHADVCFDVTPVGADRRYRVCAAEDGDAGWVQRYDADDRATDFVSFAAFNDVDAFDRGFGAVIMSECAMVPLSCYFEDR